MRSRNQFPPDLFHLLVFPILLVVLASVAIEACSRRRPDASLSLQATPPTTPSLIDSHPGLPPPAVDSANELLRSIRAQLPQGWSASFDKDSSWLEVSRDEDVLAVKFVINGSHDEGPKPTKFVLAFRIMPRMPLSEYRRLSAENEAVENEAAKLYEDLVNMRMDRKFDSFTPRTDEEKKAVARYEALKDSLHDLPDYYFRDASLEWGFAAGTHDIHVTDERTRDECTKTKNMVLKLLSGYQNR